MALLVLTGGATACGGGDSFAEGLIEDRIESEAGVDGVDIDLDSGEFRVETEDGTFEFDADGEGGFTIETDDGTFVQESMAEIPDTFPSEVPRPEGTIFNSLQQTIDGEQSYGIFYLSDRFISDIYDPWKDEMLAAGFELSFESLTADAITAQFADLSWQVTFSGSTFESESSYQFNVAPVPG